MTLDTAGQWQGHTAETAGTCVRAAENVGERFDLMGDGALLLARLDPHKDFHQTTAFAGEGSWVSGWIGDGRKLSLTRLSIDLLAYGREVDLTDWIVFGHNPVAAEYGYPHNKAQTQALPPEPPGQPQDQSVILDGGRFAGKWLLLFNIGSYALNGWGGMVADSLEPLKEGINPFRLVTDPYPMHGPGEFNAPNDWIEVGGVYYTAATTEGPASIWKSPDLAAWVHVGPLYNFIGSDPGIAFDGERFHLFIEDGTLIRHSVVDIDKNRCLGSDVVIDVGTHTGDPDIVFFNNRWHMFMDVETDDVYRIGYASTTPSDFPYGWRLRAAPVFGPENLPADQRAERSYTGDPDVALENETLYLFYENPVRVAYNELDELRDTSGMEINIQVEADADGDGQPDAATPWRELAGGSTVLQAADLPGMAAARALRVRIEMRTQSPELSPLVKRLVLEAQPAD